MKLTTFNFMDREEKIKYFSRRINPHLFLITICLILLQLAFGGWFFYYYVALEIERGADIPEGLTAFNQDSYHFVLKKWNDNSEMFENLDFENYQNPFPVQDITKTTK